MSSTPTTALSYQLVPSRNAFRHDNDEKYYVKHDKGFILEDDLSSIDGSFIIEHGVIRPLPPATSIDSLVRPKTEPIESFQHAPTPAADAQLAKDLIFSEHSLEMFEEKLDSLISKGKVTREKKFQYLLKYLVVHPHNIPIPTTTLAPLFVDGKGKRLRNISINPITDQQLNVTKQRHRLLLRLYDFDTKTAQFSRRESIDYVYDHYTDELVKRGAAKHTRLLKNNGQRLQVGNVLIQHSEPQQLQRMWSGNVEQFQVKIGLPISINEYDTNTLYKFIWKHLQPKLHNHHTATVSVDFQMLAYDPRRKHHFHISRNVFTARYDDNNQQALLNHARDRINQLIERYEGASTQIRKLTAVTFKVVRQESSDSTTVHPYGGCNLNDLFPLLQATSFLYWCRGMYLRYIRSTDNNCGLVLVHDTIRRGDNHPGWFTAAVKKEVCALYRRTLGLPTGTMVGVDQLSYLATLNRIGFRYVDIHTGIEQTQYTVQAPQGRPTITLALLHHHYFQVICRGNQWYHKAAKYAFSIDLNLLRLMNASPAQRQEAALSIAPKKSTSTATTTTTTSTPTTTATTTITTTKPTSSNHAPVPTTTTTEPTFTEFKLKKSLEGQQVKFDSTSIAHMHIVTDASTGEFNSVHLLQGDNTYAQSTSLADFCNYLAIVGKDNTRCINLYGGAMSTAHILMQALSENRDGDWSLLDRDYTTMCNNTVYCITMSNRIRIIDFQHFLREPNADSLLQRWPIQNRPPHLCWPTDTELDEDQWIDKHPHHYLRCMQHICTTHCNYVFDRFGLNIESFCSLPGLILAYWQKTRPSTHRIYLPRISHEALPLRSATYGGRTIALKRHFRSKFQISNLTKQLSPIQMQQFLSSKDYLRAADVDSAHAFAMYNNAYPVGEPIHENSHKPLTTKDLSLKVGVYLIEYQAPRNLRVPILLKHNGRIIHDLHDGHGWYYWRDVESAIKLGYNVQQREAWLWPQADYIFKDFITDVYPDKIKQRGNGLGYQIAKAIPNVLYGKLTTKMGKYQTQRCSSPQEYDRFTQQNNVDDIQLCSNSTSLFASGTKRTEHLEQRDVRSPHQLGGAILAHLRAYMTELMQVISPDLTKAPFYYTATDSLVINQTDFERLQEAGYCIASTDTTDPCNTQLGKLKDDFDQGNGESGYIFEADFYGPNRYRLRYVDQHGQIKTKMAYSGIAKGSLTWERFAQQNTTQNNGMIYNDGEWYPDGYQLN